MKNIVFIVLLFVSTLLYSQAKKPTIMVVPSDRYCIANGYVQVFDQMGQEKEIPDYKKSLQHDEKLRLAISQMGAIMVERGFPLKDLESEMKKLENEEVTSSVMMSKGGSMILESPIDVLRRTAKADIILDLDFSVKEGGLGRKYINFNLKGIDSYSSKIIASATGSGKPYMTEQVELLLQMAVKDHMDGFNALLSDFFADMFEKGREISVQIKIFDSSIFDLETEYSYSEYEMNDELGYIIEEFFNRTSVKHRFSVIDMTESAMKIEQLRMPIFDEKGRAIDSRRYIRELQKILKKPPFNIQSKLYMKGLGEAWLILGEK